MQECEDLRKENKFLANEIHMERIMMRTENELIMRNLRNLNQELQAEVKEVRAPDFCPASPRKAWFYRLPTQKKRSSLAVSVLLPTQVSGCTFKAGQTLIFIYFLNHLY